jgi:arylsulfatase A-like enzyme
MKSLSLVISAPLLPLLAMTTPPNIIPMMGDDHGWEETGYNGHPHVKTPVFDEMAATGLKFERFYAAHSNCSPTRASFITAHKDKPFFVDLPFYSVHTPLAGRPDLVEKYEGKRKKLGLEPKFVPEHPRENRAVQEHAVYAAMVEAMDQAIGKVLRSLEDNGVKDDTIVIFFSDNGGLSIGDGSPTSNLPLRAGKA